MKKRVTLDDIAAACNTSPATVSLALRNRAGVSRARRAEILETARRLGYVARHRAMEPDAPPMRNVALIFRTPDWTAERSAPALNQFYSWVLTGIQDGAGAHRMNLNLGTIPVDVSNHATTLPDLLLAQPLDGVLLVGAFQEETVVALRDRVQGAATPMVLVDGVAAELDIDSVTSDHRRGMATATQHLISQGHRRIAFAGPPAGVDANFDLRRTGYRDAVSEAGLPADEIDIGLEDDELPALLARWRGKITALVCGNDHLATVIVQAARRAGIGVPDDLSLIGFDDTMEGRHSHPTISTMAVDKAGIGLLAVKLLQHRLDWPEAAPMQLTLGTRLIERESVAMCAAPDGQIDVAVDGVAGPAMQGH